MITDFTIAAFLMALGTGLLSGLTLWVAHHELKRFRWPVWATFGLGMTTNLAAVTATFILAIGLHRLDVALPVAWLLGAAVVGLAALVNQVSPLPSRNWGRVAVYVGGSLLYLPVVSLFFLLAAWPGEGLELVSVIWVVWATAGTIVVLFYWLDNRAAKERGRNAEQQAAHFLSDTD